MDINGLIDELFAESKPVSIEKNEVVNSRFCLNPVYIREQATSQKQTKATVYLVTVDNKELDVIDTNSRSFEDFKKAQNHRFGEGRVSDIKRIS